MMVTATVSFHTSPLMKNYRLLLLLFFIPALIFSQHLPKSLDKTVILKVKPAYRSLCDNNSIRIPQLQNLFTQLGNCQVVKKFPYASVPGQQRSKDGHRLVDLSLIYQLTYSAPFDVTKAINLLKSAGVLEYAEPHYIPELLYSPNDPGAIRSIQYYLTNIKAYQAWDVNKGDTNMVVGITDTGTDLTHPELFSSIKKNYLDPVDGIDNDLDGYTDNFYGWDLGENDNNPTWAALAHGVHVSGLSSAVTDNATGMAGTGFNCKYLPVKISNASGSLVAAYEAIVYAADHGCKVINCSWGSTGGGQFGQDIVDYAVFNKDALVISAAGNDNKLIQFYPASYKHVLNVAATDSLDRKSAFSNYACTVDLSAPGAAIYSTWPNGYLYSNGTSMSAPIVAGAAALVRSQFPSFTALQVLEQLKSTTDQIYQNNSLYLNMLGTGRLNMFRSLTVTGIPGIDLEEFTASTNGTNVFASGDTVKIVTYLKNYLAATQNLTLTLRSASQHVSIVDSVYSMGPLTTFELDSNSIDPFDVYVKPTAPTNGLVRFTLIISDGSYTVSYCFDITVNVDYINVNVNDIATTITSRGKIGFNSDNQMNGLGFVYNDQADLLYEAGLMIGTSSSKVSDAVRGETQGVSDRDFRSLQNVRHIIPSEISDFDLLGIMNDDSAGISKINVRITQNTHAWSIPGHTKYVMLRYSIKNPSNLPVVGLNAGIFTDWDIQNSSQNRASYDAGNRLGYSFYSGAASYYAGVKVLSGGNARCYSIDNIQGGGGGVDLSDGFNTSEKYTTLSSSRNNAGQNGNGNDVIQVVSAGPYTILPGDSITVAFAMLAGESLADLQNSAVNAQQMYDTLFPVGIEESNFRRLEVYPNPVKADAGQVSFTATSGEWMDVKVLASDGRTVASEQMKPVAGQLMNIRLPQISAGLYHILTEQGNVRNTARLIVLP